MKKQINVLMHQNAVSVLFKFAIYMYKHIYQSCSYRHFYRAKSRG